MKFTFIFKDSKYDYVSKCYQPQMDHSPMESSRINMYKLQNVQKNSYLRWAIVYEQ